MRTGEKRILILGGGFAGVYAARTLEKLLRPEEAVLCLVNRENYWVYQPMIPEVISGAIGLTDVVAPIRQLCSRTELVMREVEAIDLKKKLVTVSPGFRPRRMEISYDYLVIALGSTTKFSGMPGLSVICRMRWGYATTSSMCWRKPRSRPTRKFAASC